MQRSELKQSETKSSHVYHKTMYATIFLVIATLDIHLLISDQHTTSRFKVLHGKGSPTHRDSEKKKTTTTNEPVSLIEQLVGYI